MQVNLAQSLVHRRMAVQALVQWFVKAKILVSGLSRQPDIQIMKIPARVSLRGLEHRGQLRL